MHLNCELLFRKYAIKYFYNNINVLEIGSTGSTSLFKKIINNPTIKWYTIDIGTQWIGDITEEPLHTISEFEYKYPYDDNTFDVVISGNVMEHVSKVWSWFSELKRITKNRGLIITISPLSWDYHAAPIDCWRIYPHGMNALIQKEGLEILINTYESLEKNFIPKSTPILPGNSSIKMDRSFRKRNKTIIIYNKILHFIPVLKFFKIPLTACYDIICICQK